MKQPSPRVPGTQRRHWLALLSMGLLLSTALAGCTSGAPPFAPTGTWFVEGDKLVARPEPGTVLVAWGWEDVGRDVRPQAIMLPPVDGAWTIERATFTGWFEAARETAAPEGKVGGFLAWLSIDGRFVARSIMDGPHTILPGSVYEVDLAFPVPAGGIHVDPGQTIAVHLGTQYGQGDDVLLHTSAEWPSGLAMVSRPSTPQGDDWRELTAFPGLAPVDCTDEARHPSAGYIGNFTIPEDATGLRVKVTRGPGPGNLDLEPWFYNATGHLVAYGTSPLGNETLQLNAENLELMGRGEWRLRMFCHSQNAPFLTVIEVLHA